tara:strand:- start:2976 stop:3635 length:660 start_codon:yes stop_codon:yes gene_type:complete
MNREEKKREFFAQHAETFTKLKLASPFFVVKTAFYQTGKYGRNIQLFEGELKRNEDIFIEFVDVQRDEQGAETDYLPMFDDRQLFKFKANPYFAEEYEVKENAKYSAYTVPVSELMAVSPNGSEISYALYEKRKEDAKKNADSLPRLQTTLSIFPDFEQEFAKREEAVQTAGSDFDIDKAVESTLSHISLKDFAAIMLVQPVSDKEWLNDLITKTKKEL